MSGNKIYLGDGAYAEFGGYDIRITTEDGVSVTNEVFLGPREIVALIVFAKEKGLVT